MLLRDPGDVADALAAVLREGDVVLLKASRAMGLELAARQLLGADRT